jgi:hypothetical protein
MNYQFKPDGVHECEPIIYTKRTVFRNVTVEIWENENGDVSIGWIRQDDTEEIADEEDAYDS